MANFERGAYEPRGGDDLPIFDGAIDEEDTEEGSRLPLLIVIALLVLAAFAGVVWLAYTQGVQRGRADAPRIIAAEPGPEKVAPASPGGTATPYTGLKIYQQPAPADDASDTDTAPQPPTPTRTAAAPRATAPAVTPPDLRSAANAAPESVTPTPTTAKPVARVVAPPPSKPAVSIAAATPQIATHAPTKLNAPATTKPVAPPAAAPPTQTVANAPPPTTTSAAPSPASTASTPAPSSTPGAYVLQIGAYKSQDEASASWHAFKASHAMVGGYASRIKKVDLGAKGTWYRLQLASFADKDSATAFCEKLKADSGNCFVAK
jgi:cell division protein FtsN